MYTHSLCRKNYACTITYFALCMHTVLAKVNVACANTCVPQRAYLHVRTDSCVPTRAYLHVRTNTCVPTRAYRPMRTNTCVPSRAYQHVRTYTCVPARAYQHVNQHVHTNTCVPTYACVPTHVSQYMYTNTCTLACVQAGTRTQGLHAARRAKHPGGPPQALQRTVTEQDKPPHQI